MHALALDSSDWEETEANGILQEVAIKTIEDGLSEVAKHLPQLSPYLTIAVRPYFKEIIPEYGVGARTWDSEFIEIWLDKSVPHGSEKTLRSIYETTFHEAYHAARWNIPELGYDDRIVAGAVFEGLATVFERDYAKYQPPYGIYEDDATMANWFGELEDAGSDWSLRQNLFFTHTDGRRWIAYKTGTWVVDRAIARSGKSVEGLIDLPMDEIIKLADIRN